MRRSRRPGQLQVERPHRRPGDAIRSLTNLNHATGKNATEQACIRDGNDRWHRFCRYWSFCHKDLMPIPDAESAVVAAEKVRDYLLNRDHPDGGSKAVWFESLGYTRSNDSALAEDLLAIARECETFGSEITKFGVESNAVGVIAAPGHRPGHVMTVWIVEDDDPPRLVTAYPDSGK